MKKIFISTFLCLSIATASSAFAATNTSAVYDIGGTAPTTKLTIQLSNTVVMEYTPDTTNKGLVYTVSTYHNQGTRSYASTSADSKIFWHDGTNNLFATLPASPTDSSKITGAGNWTAL